jgi:hypothetical protein
MKRKLVAILAVIAVVLSVGLVPTVSVGADPDPGLGLVGLWRFDGNANDSSGIIPPNNGTVYGGAGYTTGKFNQGINLDGTDDYVEIPDSPSLDITDKLTIDTWVKLDSFFSPYTCIVTKTALGQGSYSLLVVGEPNSPLYRKALFVVYKDGDSTLLSSQPGNTSLSLGQWYHIAATYEYQGDGSSVMKLFINGVLDSPSKTDAVGPIFSGSSPLRIGAAQLSPTYYDGTIDEVRIYNTALSPQAIALHAAGCYEPNGRILGQVRVGGAGVGNIQLLAFDATTGQYLTATNTNAMGNYAFNLPAGGYKVQARPSWSGLPYVNEYYNNVYQAV